MKKQLEQVKAFHKAFGVDDILDKPTTDVNENIKELRLKLMREELDEVCKSIERKEDIHDLAKELSDLLYVIYGTIVAFGLTDYMEKVFDEVHNSNMSKLDENGIAIRREDGKVLKSSGYKAPNIKNIF